MKEIIEVAGVILATLGSGGVIVFALSSWLGKVWANRLMAREILQHSKDLETLRNELHRDIESYKIKLKKSEVIFDKEIEAASNLVALIRGFLPTNRYPNMDWHEACDEIAHNFERIESSLNDFLSRYGAVLPDEVMADIISCIGIAGDEKFEVMSCPEVSPPSNKVADDLFKRLSEAESSMLAHVKSQASL